MLRPVYKYLTLYYMLYTNLPGGQLYTTWSW